MRLCTFELRQGFNFMCLCVFKVFISMVTHLHTHIAQQTMIRATQGIEDSHNTPQATSTWPALSTRKRE